MTVAALPAHRVATPVLGRLRAGRSGELGQTGGPGGGGGTRGPDGPEVRGLVLGAGATAAWVDLDGFVIAVTTREVPLLPNAMSLAAGAGALVRAGVAAGATARAGPGRIDLGPARVTWDPAAPPAWDPTVPAPPGAAAAAVGRRGAAVLRALGAWPEPAEAVVDSREPSAAPSATLPIRGPQQPGGAEKAVPQRVQPGVARTAARERVPAPVGLDARALVRELARIGLPTAGDPEGGRALGRLFEAVAGRDPGRAAGAARRLLGRGPGLTPEGDDLVAAVAGTLAVLGPAADWDRSVLASLLAALVAHARERTTALSATLLELAAQGRLVEPAGRLLDLGPGGEAAWPAALARLERLGHGSGRAYAAGLAATARLLAAGPPAG